ncbi:MAG: DMT family transporter [Desulfuromonadales bacterium]|nr:DMT family transporter [Desulfuromonadales bacterium]
MTSTDSHPLTFDPTLQRRAVFLLVFCTLLWGGSFLVTKIGLRDFPPITFMTLRFIGAALLMAALCGRRLQKLNLVVTTRGALIGTALAAANIMFVIGISGTTISLSYCIIFPTVIAFTLQNTWQRFINPTQAGLLYTFDPVWSLLAGLFFLHEDLSRREWLGCALLFSANLLPLPFRLNHENRSAA